MFILCAIFAFDMPFLSTKHIEEYKKQLLIQNTFYYVFNTYLVEIKGGIKHIKHWAANN